MKKQSEVIHYPLQFVKCKDCGVKKLCFTRGLSDQDVKTVQANVTSHHSYGRGDYLFFAGDSVHNLFVIKSGSAKSNHFSSDGMEQVLGFHLPGEILGLDSLADYKYKSSVVFLENSRVCAIPYPAFESISNKIPELNHYLISRLSADIEHGHELQATIKHNLAEERVAFFLLDLSSRLDNRGFAKDHLHLSMSRNDIANYLGLASETVSRALTKFERDGLINVEYKNVQLTNIQSLKKHTNLCEECSAMYL